METNTESQELTVIDKSIDVFKGGSEILKNNQRRSAKALAVGQKILAAWEAAYLIDEPSARKEALAAVDTRSNDFLVNCGIAKTEMEDSRKAITQLMDVIKKMFTAEENNLDPKGKETIPATIQSKRNQYAKEVLAQQEEERKALERKAAIEKQTTDVRYFIRNHIAGKLLEHLNTRKIKISDTFNKITLETFDEKSEGLVSMNCQFNKESVKDLFNYQMPATPLLDDALVLVIRSEEHTAYDFKSFEADYERHIGELKQSLVDRLPSKKAELDELKRLADEAEAQRIESERIQKEAEDKRRAELAKAADDQKEALAKQQEIDRQKEINRQKQLEKEKADQQALIEQQAKQRELDDQIKLQKEAEELQQKANESLDIQKAGDIAATLFSQTAEASLMVDTPEARSNIEITVNNPAGIVELFQFWFLRESSKLSIEEMMKKSLNQIKAYAEKAAQKDDTRINSKYISYSSAIKSVNRKAK